NGRYYFAAVFQQRLYVEAWSMLPEGRSEVFDGMTWSQGPELLPAGGHGFRPIVFAGRLVYATKQTFETIYRDLAATPNKLIGFDGKVASVIFDHELLDFFGNDRELLVLGSDGVLWRTRDLASWSRVADGAAIHPRSLALLDGVVYVGTMDS